MRGQTVGVLILIAVLSLFAADVSVGCGQGYVHGTVEQKLVSLSGEPDRQLVINGSIFQVPISFYNEVQVGDMVRFTGGDWTIEKRASAPAPASPSP
ncbi:MAG TPA: hypothetical protein VEW91_11725 [bacterium]|nr:hypothetical protein [bacterium]